MESGGRSPYTWSKVGGALPEDVTVGTKNDNALISGTPSEGKYNFLLKVTDADGRSAIEAFSVTYENEEHEYGSTEGGVSLPEVSGEFPAGAVGASYSGSATASSGTAPYTWEVSYGDLPGGVSLTGATGQTARITGTPEAEGFYNFVLKVTDANGITNARTFVIKVAGNSSSTNGNTGNNTDNTNGNTGGNTNNDGQTDNGTGNNTNGAPEPVSGSSGGGGCNSGLAILALALTALITLRKSRS